ncbi:MAG: hypothetical protein IJX02_08825 [Clostridia bacterium]|nr:hypothetical protein [Clostridia bacterium]
MKIVLSIVAVFLVLILPSCSGEEYTTRTSDINLFINEEYAKETDDYYKSIAGKNAQDFFPPYNEIEYKYTEINFYTYACADFFVYPDYTYVLELVFNDETEYEKAKADIHSIYDFLQEPIANKSEMPACEYQINKFLVKILTEGADDNFPHSVYAICENDKEHVIRYLYLYDIDHDILVISDFAEAVVRYTSCTW